MLNTRQTFNHIMAQIQEFEDSLDDDKEVSVLLTSFGPALLMNVTGIGFMNPDLVFFYGTVDRAALEADPEHQPVKFPSHIRREGGSGGAAAKDRLHAPR